mmetsp:Transcript_33809/g.110544  ORF Transcript_33809/g.110544 Transcript_33809/m.110544 type:complete len:85 (-) Transcript_33809:62-316(-)
MRAVQPVHSLCAEPPRRSHPEHFCCWFLSVRVWIFALHCFLFCMYSGGAILAVMCLGNGPFSCRDDHGAFQLQIAGPCLSCSLC